MICEVQETTAWDNVGTVSIVYGIYVDKSYPDDLDYASLKEVASVINQFIERKETKK